jgi:hypothetical protein
METRMAKISNHFSLDLIVKLDHLTLAQVLLDDQSINKSTLWYIQKNLREAKKVKLYEKVRAKMA